MNTNGEPIAHSSLGTEPSLDAIDLASSTENGPSYTPQLAQTSENSVLLQPANLSQPSHIYVTRQKVNVKGSSKATKKSSDPADYGKLN